MPEIEKDKSIIKYIIWSAFIILFLAAIFSIALLVFEIKNAPSESTYDLTKIGSWGDTIGGILNPLFSFLAILALLWTIRLQREELGLSRKELKNSTEELKGSKEANQAMAASADQQIKNTNQQNIETTFFKLFDLLQTNLQTIKTRDAGISGARAFESFALKIKKDIEFRCSEMKTDERYGNPDYHRPDGLKELRKEYLSDMDMKKALFRKAYENSYIAHHADLGRYFRLVYNVLRFLSNSENAMTPQSYKVCSKIMKASLSNYELFIIMGTCFSEDGAEMRKYVAQYELFNNLPREIFLMKVCDDCGNHKDDIDLAEIWLDFDADSFGGSNDYQAVKANF